MVTWKFTDPDGYGWTKAQKARVRDAFRLWEALDDLDGASIVDFVEKGGSTEVRVYRTDLPYPRLGEARCSHGYMALDVSLSGDALEGVATHEAAHIVGLAHVSHEENLTTTAAPTMTSGWCSPTIAELRSIEHDDHAALTQRNGEDGGVARRMHADPSFEEVFRWPSYWETRNVASIEHVSDANSPWGQYHVRFKGYEPLSGPIPCSSRTYWSFILARTTWRLRSGGDRKPRVPSH